MDLSLTTEQESFRTLARDFLDREAVPFRQEWDRAESATSRSCRRWRRSGSSA